MYVVTLDLPDIRQDPHMMSGPRISIENVRASLPYKSAKDSTVQSDGSVLFDTSSHFLSHLEIVPTSDVEKSLQLPPTVVAFYTPVINAMGMANDGQLGRTTIRRWHVVSAEHKLHPSFDGIIQKWKAPTLGRRTDLQRLDDVHTNHIVTTVQKVDGGEHLVLGCADGSLTVYDPSSVTPLYMSTDPAEVTGMAQAEFVFPSSSRGLDVSVSPNACVAASLGNDGKVQLTHLEHPTGLPYDSTDPGTVEAPLAAIILSFARAFYAQISWNDIMLLVTQHLSPTHYPHLIESSLKALFPDRDLVLGPELGSPPKPIIARVLSLAASLGYDPSSRQRTLPSMLSWLTLNIRARALTFMSIWSSLNPNGGAEWKDPEVCEIACNNIKWTLDLCKFIVDDLFEMADRLSATPDGNSSYQPPDSDSTSITKLLLVSIWPRSFLKMIVRILRGFVRATQDPKTTLSREAAPSFSRMAELIESSPLKMEPLEQLLSGVDKMVQKFYEVNGMSERERSDTERYVMAHGEIPQVLHDVVPRILQDVLPLTRSKMDRLGLYMEDHSWLGIREDSKTKAFKRDFVVDVHRKKIMRRKGLGKVRKCVRCGSISADLVRMKHWPQYLHNQMLRCVCEDVFAVVGPEEV